MPSLSCLLDFGYYSSSAQCGATCVVQPLRVFRIAQYTSKLAIGLASFYLLFSHVGKL